MQQPGNSRDKKLIYYPSREQTAASVFQSIKPSSLTSEKRKRKTKATRYLGLKGPRTQTHTYTVKIHTVFPSENAKLNFGSNMNKKSETRQAKRRVTDVRGDKREHGKIVAMLEAQD